MKRERGYCARCRREVSLRKPRGGDGSLVVAAFHHGPTSFDTTRCPGVGQPPRELARDEKPRVVT